MSAVLSVQPTGNEQHKDAVKSHEEEKAHDGHRDQTASALSAQPTATNDSTDNDQSKKDKINVE